MNTFDDYSWRNPSPAGLQLAALLDRTADEIVLFSHVTPLQFVAQCRRYLDRGLKWAIVLYTMRAAMELTQSDGHGNAARRRAERLRAQFEAEADAATAAWFDENGGLLPEDVDALAERYSESRRAHYHDLPIAQRFHEI